ncbi:MAG: TonB family protein [Acidobacteria bacterium]|nr:TonB family protein [Acidobacteriota bacterium]
MAITVRVVIPRPADLGWLGGSVLVHVLLVLALFFGIWSGREGQLGQPGKSMVVRLAARPGGARAAAAAPAPAPPRRAETKPPPPVEKKEETARKKPNPPKTVVDRPEGPTAQPETLPQAEPQPEPPPAGPGGAGTSPGQPGTGPIAGGVAGLGTDEPFTADWYANLVVARLQDQWRERPLLPAGSPSQRVVVSFVIRRDGTVEDVQILAPSGYTPLDQSAYRAVVNLGRLPPLPRSYERQRLRARFVFELVPPGA